MKKLLAALIVATMLISCMSLVAFAAAPVVRTIASFDNADLTNQKAGRFQVFTDEYTDAYYNALDLNAGFGKKLDDYLYGETSTLDTTFTVGDVIAVPVFGNAATTMMYFDYDDDFLSPNTSVSYGFNNVSIKTEGYYANAYGGTDDERLIGFVTFTVNSGAVGDASGNATTDVSLRLSKVASSSEELGTLGTPNKMTISLTGLTPGAGPAKPEKVTGDDDTAADAVKVSDAVVLADTSSFTAAAGDDAALLASKANVVNNDGDPTLYDGTYQIFFGKNNFSGVTTAPDKVGLALYEGTTLKGLYEAQSFSADGKWGILFFGLNSQKTYSTKQFIQYDGDAAIIAE